MFKMTEENINDVKKIYKTDNPRAGAAVYFEGIVRNHNEGHDVSSLEYQAYESMANKEGQKIIDEAIKKFDIYDCFCVHRMGHLKIGDNAVYVVANSAHRAESFRACEYIINEVKLRVPIWKKEHYINKDAEWVACHHCAHPHEHGHGQKHDHSHYHEGCHSHE